MDNYKGFRLGDRIQIKPGCLGSRFDRLPGIIIDFVEVEGITYIEAMFKESFYEDIWTPKGFNKNTLYLYPRNLTFIQHGYLPSAEDKDAVQGNADLLGLEDITSEMVEELTECWSPDFKKAVWKVLPPQTKENLKVLMGSR